VTEPSALVTSICVGTPQIVRFEGKSTETSIFKTAVNGPVVVSERNIAGDSQADLSAHGGRNKAVYAYPEANYQYWLAVLGRNLELSQFGENLTVRGVTEKCVVIGDRYRVGNCELTVTQPRLPCFKLGIRLNDSEFPAAFLTSGRLGFYLRVEKPGVIQCHDAFHLIERPQHGISLFALWSAVFKVPNNPTISALALEQLRHLDSGWRRRLLRVRDAQV
jgi:MOSC domain-containing protein YiiM